MRDVAEALLGVIITLTWALAPVALAAQLDGWQKIVAVVWAVLCAYWALRMPFYLKSLEDKNAEQGRILNVLLYGPEGIDDGEA